MNIVYNVRVLVYSYVFFFFSSRRRHTRLQGDWSSDVCSSDLLKLSRLGRAEMKKQQVDLTSLAQSIVAELRKADPARNVEVVIAPDLRAYGDERLLRAALENLLRNAWKFTSEQPRARIEVGK